MELSRLYCNREKDFNLFFSIMDLLNSLFISDKIEDILEFYSLFDSREELIRWMKERPKGLSNIIEVEGNKDIIVVIPTADVNGKYAKECRENIFKGFHIIFVESGNFHDPYFNYAHNCNVGIKKAMEYQPKWIVLSNDDVVSLNNSKDLLMEISNEKFRTKLMLLPKNRESEIIFSIAKLNRLGESVFRIINYTKILEIIVKHHRILELIYKYRLFLIIQLLNNKFGNRYIIIRPNRRTIFIRIFYKVVYTFYNFQDFGIFSIEYLRKAFPLFDETFINAHEDIRASVNNQLQSQIGWIDYTLYGIGSVSLGHGTQRYLRNIAGDSYFNFLIEMNKLF